MTLINPEDNMCRFVRESDWSALYKRPTPQAFKGNNGMSVWHTEQLEAKQEELKDLRIMGLKGAGQAHHEIQDYRETAEQAGLNAHITQEENSAGEPWARWKYAHYEIQTNQDDCKPAPYELKEFRRLLVKNTRKVIPPD